MPIRDQQKIRRAAVAGRFYEDDALDLRRRMAETEAQLEVLESALREGCIGQLPEIYDGENPVSSKGCFAQAWSVGELLRVFERLEEHE